jgi:hypothetical protein
MMERTSIGRAAGRNDVFQENHNPKDTIKNEIHKPEKSET